VNDLLDLSKIEAGRVDLELSPVSLFGVLHEVKETLAPRAAELGLALAVDVSLENDLIIADEARPRQVLVNLAGNAIKYTATGGVRVRQHRRRTGTHRRRGHRSRHRPRPARRDLSLSSWTRLRRPATWRRDSGSPSPAPSAT
jgi:signal transduction histidine kinase